MNQRNKGARSGNTWADVGARVAMYLDRLFDGNKSKMAQFLGVTHTAVAKTVAGESAPGFKLLAALIQHPSVSAVWLMTGTGEPFGSEATRDHGVGWPVPIARELLPGPPRDYSNMLTKETFAVAGEHYRDTRYFYRVPPDHLILEDIIEKARRGDLILFETDRATLQTLDYWSRRLCVVRVPWDNSLMLGSVTAMEQESELQLDTFELGMRKSPDAYRITVVVAPQAKPQVSYEPLRRGTLPRGRKPRFQDMATNPNAKFATISRSDVVAVAELLVRPCP